MILPETGAETGAAPQWQPRPDRFILAAGELHLWQASLTVSPERYQPALDLSVDEVARYARLRSPADRRFAVARTILRRLLARYLHCEPAAIAFDYGDRGKPELRWSQSSLQPPLRFNLSHSQDVAVYAVAPAGRVGVDVECLRPVPAWAKLASRYFSPQEQQRLSQLAGRAQQREFLRIWTQKEAYVKATGEGIAGLAVAKVPDSWFCASTVLDNAVVATVGEDVTELKLFRWA